MFAHSKMVLSMVALLAVLAGCQRSGTSSAADERVNVVFISLDTLRARSLGAYGHSRRTSPFFDELAAQGVLFETAITTSATTGPSHMSLFTGMYPRSHGMITGLEVNAVPESLPRLAQLLKEAGYSTKAITENGFIIRGAGFESGFDEYSEHVGDKNRSAPGLVDKSFGEAREWLRGARGAEPFFLFVHTYQVHHPYSPPPKYQKLFSRDGLGNKLAEIRYDQEIAYLDEELAKLLAEINVAKRERETLVVIVSDHGEEFFEHGAFQHGAHVFEEVIHVPLLFWGAGITVPRRVAGQVSIIDVAPTVLDLLGISIPDAIEGKSLKNTILSGADPPQRPIFAEATSSRQLLLPSLPRPVEPFKLAVRFDQRKFIVHRPRLGEREPTVMFDLENDPLEINPIPVSGDELVEVESLVDRYLASGGRGRAGAASADEFKRDADPALIERLRSLGYIE